MPDMSGQVMVNQVEFDAIVNKSDTVMFFCVLLAVEECHALQPILNWSCWLSRYFVNLLQCSVTTFFCWSEIVVDWTHGFEQSTRSPIGSEWYNCCSAGSWKRSIDSTLDASKCATPAHVFWVRHSILKTLKTLKKGQLFVEHSMQQVLLPLGQQVYSRFWIKAIRGWFSRWKGIYESAMIYSMLASQDWQ